MRLHRTRNLLCAAFGAALLASTLIAPAAAQQAYPTKPIRLVVGFAPGGLTDVYARLFASHLQTKYGQPVVVDNKPGAATIVGTQIVAKAPPDGYTLCFCVTNVTTNQFFRTELPYKVEELTPIALGFRSTTVLIVPGDSPFQTVRDLVDFAKKNPGKLNYSTTGSGGATHLVGELFNSVAGIQTVPVPYKGAAPATMAVGTKEVQYAFSAIATAKPLLQDKRVRALAVAEEVRVPAVADVPTMAEAGYNGVATGVWYGLMAPTGTPRPIIDLLNQEMNAFFTSKPIVEKLVAGGERPLGNATPQQMADYIARDTEVMRKIIQPLNLKLE
ncbi:MAG TPA: tripartite tricarboxylate transporter substrate binding protein [Ramlibacter sp.]|jgi:tripartite-type tricarboxylate transporter receptor subunit TctC|nr:tripartite tricarboxylate transporter substrate binding protein [Ramlibacter sp.]